MARSRKSSKHEGGAVLFGLAGALFVAAGGFAGGYYYLNSRTVRTATHEATATKPAASKDAGDSWQAALDRPVELIAGGVKVRMTWRELGGTISRREAADAGAYSPAQLKQLAQRGRSPLMRTNQFEEEPAESIADDLAHHLQKDRQFEQMAESLTRLGEPCKTLLEDFYISEDKKSTEKHTFANMSNMTRIEIIQYDDYFTAPMRVKRPLPEELLGLVMARDFESFCGNVDLLLERNYVYHFNARYWVQRLMFPILLLVASLIILACLYSLYIIIFSVVAICLFAIWKVTCNVARTEQDLLNQIRIECEQLTNCSVGVTFRLNMKEIHGESGVDTSWVISHIDAVISEMAKIKDDDDSGTHTEISHNIDDA